MESCLRLLGLRGHKEDPKWRAFLLRWLLLSLAIHLVTAVFSIGHHSADEYFQILEFLSFKLGKTPTHHLPTEFREQMRSWVQPGIYYWIARGWMFLDVYNPFTWATSFRVFSGLIGWISTVCLALCSRFWFADPRARKFAVISLCLFWFFPVLHVRPSSESLASSCFLIGLCLSYLGWYWGYTAIRSRMEVILWFLVGSLLGLSFEFRFQMGLMIFGLFCWLVVFGRIPGRISTRALFSMVIGAGAVFLFSRYVDYWGYGNWVLSPLNYYHFNLTRGEVSKYGTSPWWDVFRMSMTETWPVLGFLLATSTVVAWIRHPKHILTWAQVPFFLVHVMIAHKELRFFFPIALAGPILLTLSIYSPWTQRLLSLDPKGSKRKRESRLKAFFFPLANWIWKFLVLNNVLALICLMFMPFARVVQFYQGVFRQITPEMREFHLYYKDRNPYIFLGNPIFFYRPFELKLHQFQTYPELKETIATNPHKSPVWLFDPHLHLENEAQMLAPNCTLVYQTLPPILEKINWGHWMERTLTWNLYRCEPK